MSFYRNALENWLQKIDVNAEKVLDVGGGEKPVKDRVASWNVKDYKIADNDPQFKPDYLADLNYDITFGEKSDGTEWLTNDDYLFAGSKPAKVDVVFCLEVFEYIFNPVQAMKNIASFLKEGGIAYISYPCQYPLHQPKEIDSLRYTKYGIMKLIQAVGLEIKEMRPRIATKGREALADFFRLENMHPVKGTDEVFDIGYLCKVYKKDKNEKKDRKIS